MITLRLKHCVKNSFQDHQSFVVETLTRKEIITGHPASVRLGLIQVLCKNYAKPCPVLKLSKPITCPRSDTSMVRQDQQTGTNLSPEEKERVETNHLKTLFQDPSPTKARTRTKGPNRVHFKTPNLNLNTQTVRLLIYEASPVPFKTIIHDGKHTNDKMIKISSFQDHCYKALHKG